MLSNNQSIEQYTTCVCHGNQQVIDLNLFC